MVAKRLQELEDLSGRVALITGGAGHVGLVAAETFAERGASVVLLDRDGGACRAAAERVGNAFGVSTSSVECDLEDLEGTRRCVGGIVERHGRLDVLVNSAAFVGSSDLGGWNTDFANQTVETFSRALTVNLSAPFFVVQAAATALGSSGNGAVINLSSIYGSVGPDLRLYEGLSMSNPGAYAASKGGLEQLTRWMATVLAPEVRVNAIAPGGIHRGQDDEFVRRYVDRVPLGRMAAEDDLRGAFAYLGSDLSRYVTGQTIVVDGGWTAW